MGCLLPYDAFDEAVKADPFVPKIAKSRYHYAFFGLIRDIGWRQAELGLAERIDFVFDEQVMEKSAIYETWKDFSQHSSVNKELLGSPPIFASDRRVLPLQVADMAAWMVRKLWIEHISGRPPLVMPWAGKTIPEKKMLLGVWTKELMQQHIANVKRYREEMTAGFSLGVLGTNLNNRSNSAQILSTPRFRALAMNNAERSA